MSRWLAPVLLTLLLFGCKKPKSEGPGDRIAEQLECGKGNTAACAAHLARTRKRCDSGDAEGCVLLGIIYQVGKITPKDAAAAVPLFAKACDAKNGSGCYYLGSAHEQGRGTERNVEAARAAYERGCSLYHDNACISLGDLFARPGPLQDRAKALAAFDAACAIPYKGGCDRASALRAKP